MVRRLFLSLILFTLSQVHAEYTPPACAYSQQKGTKVYTKAFSKAFDFVTMNQIKGDVVEFGTLGGFTASIFAKLMTQYRMTADIHLFDSFEGLPTITSEVDLNSYEVKKYKVWFSGAMAMGPEIPKLIRGKLEETLPKESIHIHKGFFDKTLQPQTLKKKPAIIHIDCDLYQSAKEVLSKLFAYDLIQDGAIILFDDYNCGRANPNFGERKAFKEVMDANPNYSSELYYYYSWHGAAFIIHKN